MTYYRVINPANKLQELFSDHVEVRLDENPLGRSKDGKSWEPNWKFENLNWCDVVWTANIPSFGGNYVARLIGLAKERKKICHFDTDDYLVDLPEEHKLSETYKNLRLGDITKFIYSHSDLVTVTQNKFAERIKPFCTKFLAVIKNAIDYNLPSWQQKKKLSKICRIGWMAGVHHNYDLEQFRNVPTLVNQKCGSENVKWQMYGHPPPNPDGNKDWQWDTWKTYMGKFLGAMKGRKNFEVFMALPPSDYGVYYSDLDISIAPLANNLFNDSKSDVKVAECSKYSIPLVATNIGCYEDTIINGETGYLIDSSAPKTEWVRILTKLIKDKSLRERLGKNLHDSVGDTFDLNKVVGQRLKIYEEVFKVIGDPRKNRNKEPNND